MKRLIMCAAASAVCFVCLAQTGFKERYDRQVRNVGYAGVGVETILDRWQEAEPDDIYMQEGRINFHFYKGQTTQVLSKEGARFMGAKPLMSLKDSTGRPVNFFEETFFDDEQFALCQKEIDKAVAAHPRELLFRQNKISTLISYEKESPDLAYSSLSSLISAFKADPAGWTLLGESIGEEDFRSMVQDYCFAFFNIGSAASYECFRNASEIMAKAYPKDLNFQTNLGTYQLVAAGNPKQALKLYSKVLKSDPENEVALKNKSIAERQIATSKKKKK